MQDQGPDQEYEPENREARSVSHALAKALEEVPDRVEAHLTDLKTLPPETLATIIDEIVPEFDAPLLHLAAGEGNLQAARALVDFGADVEALDESGDTPLQTALSSIYFTRTDAVAMLLLGRNADCLATDRYALTPLHHAASRGGRTLVEALIEAGADVNCRAGHDGTVTPLHRAAEDGNAPATAALLAAGAEMETADADGHTAFMLAVEFGNRDVAKLLVDAGCDIDCRDNKLQTPLHFAARYGDDDLIRDLVAAGASPTASDRRGQTPQQILQAFGRADLLADADATPSLDDETRTAIFRTVLFQNRPAWDDYEASSFAAILHENQRWKVDRCARVRAAITGLRAPGDSPLDRAVASAAFTFFADTMNSFAAHQNTNDGFSIEGIDDDQLYDEYWEVRAALDGYFAWRLKTED